MGLADVSGAQPFSTILGTRLDAIAIAGVVVFRLGPLLAGHCAMGILAALTSGELPRIASERGDVRRRAAAGSGDVRCVLLVPPRSPLVSLLDGHPGPALTVRSILAVVAPGALLGLALLIAGMTAATLVGRTFALQGGNPHIWLRAFAGGGLLMGLGATLVPRGNDAMLFTGVPLLPNLLTAYADFAATLLIALLVRRRAVASAA